MRRTVFASTTKFWPSARLGARPWRSSSSATARGEWVTEASCPTAGWLRSGVGLAPAGHQLRRTCITPWLSGASLAKSVGSRSMTMPAPNGPRSVTTHVIDFPVAR